MTPNSVAVSPPAESNQAHADRRVRSLAKRVFSDLAPRQRGQLAAALLAMTASALLKAVTPVLLGLAIDRMLSSGAGDLDAIAGPLAVIAAALFVAQGLDVVRRLLAENVSTAFECDNRVRAYDRLLRLPLAMLGDKQLGALQGNANRSVEGCAKLLKLLAMDLLPALIGSGMAVFVLLAKDWRVGVIMLMVIPTGFALTRRQVANQAGVRIRIRSIKDEIDGRVGGQLPMVESIRSAGAEGHFSRETAASCNDLRGTEYAHHRAMSLFDAAKSANEGVWQVLSLGAAVYASGGGLDAVGNVTAYALLYMSILAPLREMHRIVDETSESAQQAQDFYALLDTPVDAGYTRRAAGAQLSATTDTDAAVCLEGVSFAHPNSQEPVLCGVSLSIAAGERVGLVGPSGSGKSTILRLLRRMHHGYAGRISLGGYDLASLSHEELSGQVAYLTQKSHLVWGTVEENIRFGDVSATFDEVVEAARRAQVHDEIMRLPERYATMIAERGENLSGGQAQRICIARALLRQPQVLLLDEPTSALDGASERAVHRAVDALAGVTTIIVAHRLHTLRTVDRIVVIDRGVIAEEGSFDELAAAEGVFAGMLAPDDDDAVTTLRGEISTTAS
jgi:ATP-binding cassette subfamily B protein